MNSAMNAVTILSDLPRFSGNPRPGEVKFKPDMDAREFIRSLENHYLQNAITSDDKKLQILYSQIDKKVGDAVRLVNCYAGKPDVPFAVVKRDFLSMYPAFKTTELRHAAKTYFDVQLTPDNIFCGMTMLENASTAMVETYLRNESITGNIFGLYTKIPPTPTPAPAPATATSTTSSGSTPTPTPAQPPLVQVSLANLLTNFAMHIAISSQLKEKVYESVAGMGPTEISTHLMSETVKVVEKYKLKNQARKTNISEAIWTAGEVTQRPAPRPRNEQQAATPQKQQYASQGQGNHRPPLKCHRCNREGHLKRDCKVCAFCNIYGHSAKNCRKRIAHSKGKYCRRCQIHDSHDTNECYTQRNRTETRETRNVRMAPATDEHNGSSDSEEWEPTEIIGEDMSGEAEHY